MKNINNTKIKKRGTKDAQEKVRFLVIRYLKKKMGTQKEASELYGLSLSGVHKIWKKYKVKGIKVAASKKRGVKNGIKLKGKEVAEIKRIIKVKLPDQLKLPFGLWTREAVQQLIVQKYNLILSKWQVGRYLKKWGYTPQKPIRKAFEQKPALVNNWLKKEYPKIKNKAQKEGSIIYFGDETGMRSDHQSGTSYSLKGETPIIKKTGKRFSLNMLSAISNRGLLEFMVIDGKFNSTIFLQFLIQMIKYKKRKVIYITDGHPAHKTKKIKEWLALNKNKIELHFLPPYSPELNPQEYVNQDLKTNIIGKKRAINKAQMQENVVSFMNHRKKNKKQVKKYFHAKHVKYAA